MTASIMVQTGQFGYGKAPAVKILELPYIGYGLSMVILLPDEMDGLSQLEQQLIYRAWMGQG